MGRFKWSSREGVTWSCAGSPRRRLLGASESAGTGHDSHDSNTCGMEYGGVSHISRANSKPMDVPYGTSRFDVGRVSDRGRGPHADAVLRSGYHQDSNVCAE